MTPTKQTPEQEGVLRRMDDALDELHSVVIDLRKVMQEKQDDRTGGNQEDAANG